MGTILVTGLDRARGRLRLGKLSTGFPRAMTVSPFETRFTISTILSPAAGPTTPLNGTSSRSLSKLTKGKQPVTISFFLFEIRLEISIIRFSVGPLTAQVFSMITSAEVIEPACSYPALARQPFRTALSAKFVEHPKLFTKTRFVSHHDTLNALTRNKNMKVGA